MDARHIRSSRRGGTIAVAAARFQHDDVRIALADRGKNGTPVDRPRYPPRDKNRPVAEVSDLPPLPGRGGQRPDVRRDAVGEPSPTELVERAVGLAADGEIE